MNKKILVLGSLNTDIIASGVDSLLGKGELTLGGELKIGPGGKSRNIAQMIAALQENPSVYMMSVTVNDPLGLWKIPYEALQNSAVDVSRVKILEYSKVQKFPGVALIPVDKNGDNQIYVLPGVSSEFSPQILRENEDLFEKSELLVLTLEMPFETLLEAVNLANKYNIEIMFDPGGIAKDFDRKLLDLKISLIKPNEFEAEILTGVKVIDFNSAKVAADILLYRSFKSVFITHGENGAYYFDRNTSEHIQIPDLSVDKSVRDSTGCGDQTMAAFIVSKIRGDNIGDSIRFAVKCGTLQYYRAGIDPVTIKD